MSGRELYLVYLNYHADNNFEVDPWEELDEREQGAWNAVAAWKGN